MDNQYLQQLIAEVKRRPGGLLLSVAGQSEAVVLTMDRYNELMQQLSQLTSLEKKPMTILVTGGAGYIGSHVVRQLLSAGHSVIVADNLSTGKADNIAAGAVFHQGDIGDETFLESIFSSYPVEAVMHLAASIEVEESVKEPEKYLANNTLATVTLLRVMDKHGVNKIVFSSTAAVYGEPETLPINEQSSPAPINPYGHTKLLAEQAIQFYTIYRGFSAVVFRYFNACGSDFDGTLFSTHDSHLIPVVMEVAAGKRPHLTVNGKDYDTKDGTCVRDYVHVLDIAGAHLAALGKIAELPTFSVFNIGTGRGASIDEVVHAVTDITGHMVPVEIGPRREGDPATLVADNKKLREVLGYELKYSDLETIVKTSIRKVV